MSLGTISFHTEERQLKLKKRERKKKERKHTQNNY
jgi:hypothetical protein